MGILIQRNRLKGKNHDRPHCLPIHFAQARDHHLATVDRISGSMHHDSLAKRECDDP